MNETWQLVSGIAADQVKITPGGFLPPPFSPSGRAQPFRRRINENHSQAVRDCGDVDRNPNPSRRCPRQNPVGSLWTATLMVAASAIRQARRRYAKASLAREGKGVAAVLG